MSRTVITTITPFDYTNFKQEFSEKNIINQTSGTEFVIDAAASTNITDINNASTEFDVTPLGGGTKANWWGWYEGRAGLLIHQDIQTRDEYYYTTGSFSIETDAIISDTNSVSLALQISYDRYHREHDYVTADNMKGNNSVFLGLMNDLYKTNDNLLTANSALPYESGKLRVSVFDLFGARGSWSWVDDYVSKSFPSNFFTVRCKKLPNDHYQISVNYTVCTWWGKQNTEAGKWSQSNVADLWVARRLNFSLKANTVTAHELEFNYSRNNENNYTNAHGKNYEIDSNEFLQTDENTGASQRQSSILSTEIFEKYDTDRAVVSFTLLNCEKYEIGNETRYLQAEDLIYIQDSDGSLISDDINSNGVLVPSVFEIIKARPIWDGTYSMEIVCRKIDQTN